MLDDHAAVALLIDRPADGLARGQVGTVAEGRGETDVLVEFSDDDGRTYAIVSCARADLLPLRIVSVAAADPRKGPRRLGSPDGKIHIPDDFDDPLPDDIIALFEGR